MKKDQNPTTDSGYEHEKGSFEIQLKKQMSSKMRKKSKRSKVDRKALDDKMKRKSHAHHIDDQKVYKEQQDIGIDSPQTLEEEKMDEMLLDNNK